jgi:hypothetical protein
LEEAISLLENAYELDPNVETLRILFRYYIYNKNIEKAEEILLNKLDDESFDEKIELFEAKGDLLSALKLSRERRQKHPYSHNYILQESYYILMNGDFQSAYDFCRKYLEFSNFTEPYLIINYEIASKKLGHKPNEERLSRANNSEDLMVKAAVALLRNDKSSCYEYLAKELDTNYIRKYRSMNWIIFESIRDEPKFKTLYGIG